MKKEVIAYRKPDDTVSEIFNTLGTNLEFMNSSKNFRTMLITSTKPGEGKSLIAANLAVTYAKQGNKVVLVDADLRQGRQHSIFGVYQTPGLSNYLSGVSTNKVTEKVTKVEDCIQITDAENLSVISTGNIPPNPVELLSSEKLPELIEELKKKFDIIIFDGTPGSLVKDTYVVTKAVDTTAIVVSCNKIKKSEIESVISNIKLVGGHISGIILNKAKKKCKQEKLYYGSVEKFDIQELAKKEEPKKEIKSDKPVRKKRKSTTNKKTTGNNTKKTQTKSKTSVDKSEEPAVIKKEAKKIGARERSRISKERTNDMLEQINSYLDSKEN